MAGILTIVVSLLLVGTAALYLYLELVLPLRQIRHLSENLLRRGKPGAFDKGFLGLGQIFRNLNAIEADLRELDSQAHVEEFSLKTILASMAEGVIITDPKSSIQAANQAFMQMFGLQGDPIGRYVMDVLRQAEIKSLIDISVSTLRESTGEVVIEDLLDEKNQRKVFQVSVSPLGASPENLKGVVVVFHDISRIVQLEQLRREFVANVSHELCTPLAIFRGYLETLLDNRRIPAEEQTRVLNVMKRHSDRLNALVEDLLTLSRLESGRIQPEFVKLNVNRTFKQICDDWQNQFRAKSCKLDFISLDQAPMVEVDTLRFEQVFYNLLDNALKHSERGGRVEMGAVWSGGSHMDFYVKDTGAGIPSDKIGFIFQRFYRVDKARSREHGGIGLGLAIVKHIVQLHSGRVWAESAVGRGTTIWFRLPILQDGSTVPEFQDHGHPPTFRATHVP